MSVIDQRLKIQLLNALNSAHCAVTDRIPEGGRLDPALEPVLDAIDAAIMAVYVGAASEPLPRL